MLLVFAATRPGLRAHGITAFLVPMSTPGIERTARADSLGVRGLGCMDLSFTDVRVPADHVVGAVNDGFKVAMWALEGGRVAIAAQALGIGRGGARRGDPAREGAADVRQADRGVRGHPVHARGHGHRTRRGAHAHAQGRGAQGLPGEHRAGGRPGQAGGVNRRAQGRGHGDADPGVGRLPARVESRAALPGRARDGDLPGHLRGPALVIADHILGIPRHS